MKKRYQYWTSDKGKPYKAWTDWFETDEESTTDIQAKGYKGDNLLQEYC